MSQKKKINREYDYIFKLVLVGDSTVGKSSLLVRYADETFTGTYLATIGVDFRFKTIKLDNKTIKLQIWDTAGQERFKNMTASYYKGADGVILTYDICAQQSYENIKGFWLSQVEEQGEQGVVKLVVGNKADCEDRQVQVEHSDNEWRARDILFYETSAKTGDNVEQAINMLVGRILNNRLQEIQKRKQARKNIRVKGNKANNCQLDQSFDSQLSNDQEQPNNSLKLNNNNNNNKNNNKPINQPNNCSQC